MEPYHYQLRHDPQGRIIEKTETVAGRAVIWTYACDKEGRLTGAHPDGRTVCDINYDREGRRMSDYFPHLDNHYRNYAYSVMDNRLQQAGDNGYTHDENGSRSIWNSGGNVIKEVLYDPFGGIIKDSNPGLRVSIGFAGGLHDRDRGFVRFGWRDKSAGQRIWTLPSSATPRSGEGHGRPESLRHVYQPLDRARSPGRRGRRSGLVWLLFR